MSSYPPLLPGETMKEYVDRKLKPSTEFDYLISRVVEELSGFINRNMPYSVRRVEKGGSLGRGTHLRRACDVELVIFLNDYPSVADLFCKLPSLLDNTDNKLRSTWGWKTKLSKGRKVNHALHYSLKYKRETIPVVLRLAVDPFSSGKNRFDVLAEMHRSSPEVKNYYVFCLSREQNNFVNEAPDRVKDVILLLKDWTLSINLDVDPYFVELVVVDLWRGLGKPSDWDLDFNLRKAMEKLSSSDDIQIIWPEIWPLTSKEGIPVNTEPPCVWNPANPFQNLVPQGVANSNVCQAAQETLQAWDNNFESGWRKGEESLQSFIERAVRPGLKERRFRAEVNKLVKDLLHKFKDSVPGKNYQVDEVIKSGSMQKITAVQNRMDVRLVVFLRFRSMDDFLAESRHIIENLAEYLSKHSNVEIIKTNEWMVKCSLKLEGKKYDVDILPCVDMLAVHGGNKQALYDEMERQPGDSWEGKLSHYSACLARVQRDFVMDAVRDNSKLEDLIRLVKYWAKFHGLSITSYCLELICIAVYRKSEGDGGGHSLETLCYHVLKALVNIEGIRMSFSDNYRSIHCAQRHGTPFVLDPANPFANTLPLTAEERSVVAQMARASLQR